MRASPESAVRVVLVGMMGSGKSTIGRLLAERTGWPFHDNDALLERATGLSPRELVALRGEAALRTSESSALALGLSLPAPCIVGAAAGSITDPAARVKLADPLIVWLRAGSQTLARRARGATHRPWLDTDATGWMQRTLAERAPLYEAVADLVVDTEGRTSEQVADEILTWLRNSRAYH